MSVREFYESRYCTPGTRGVFFFLNSVFVDYALQAQGKREATTHTGDCLKMQYYEAFVRARDARARGMDITGMAAVRIARDLPPAPMELIVEEIDEDADMGDAHPQAKAGGPEPTPTGGTAAGQRGDGPTAKAAVLLPKERFADDIEEWKRLPQ
eukprot:4449996-Prorocentrum_lima.AAC.1